ncbi:sugar ABC transporter permease [Microbacterium sp.]|uniref:sugar ABC transporter permease n=1 Tax=Microbacterium sp. TaxID=51671 RepID=UPI0039E59B4A
MTPSFGLPTIRTWWNRGELGLWPVLVALLLIGVGFQLANDAFLSPRNLSNLVLQTGTLAVLTLGIMLVLLLGEIDLSIGAVSGLTASVMALLSASAGWPAWAAILIALVIGATIGLVQGSWVVVFKAPSFIVTLAGMLVWQGLQLFALSGKSGQVRIEDPFLTSIASTYLPRPAGWAVAVGITVVGAGIIVIRRRIDRRAGYDANPALRDIAIGAVVAIIALGGMAVLDRYLGMPYLLLIMLAVTGVLALLTSSTVFGRHIYAVGGNAEAARRTGIRVGWLRIAIFVTAAVLAVLAGILDASRSYSVSVNTGGGNTSLNAIAAAVIGGTSLFGGRGTIVGALLGALVISSVQNGLALLGQPAAVQVIATGLILLAAVTIDMTARNRRSKGAIR